MMINTTKRHTPGPWTPRADRTVVADGVPILRFYANRNEHANARLVSMAPELLDVCAEAANLLADYLNDPAAFTRETVTETALELDRVLSLAYGYVHRDNYTVGVAVEQDHEHPVIWRATSVTGPGFAQGYTLWHTDAEHAAEAVERCIRAVFPEHAFDFTRTGLPVTLT